MECKMPSCSCQRKQGEAQVRPEAKKDAMCDEDRAAIWCRHLMPCSMVSQFSRSVRKFRCHNFTDFDLVSKISDARSSRHYLHDIQRPQNVHVARLLN